MINFEPYHPLNLSKGFMDAYAAPQATTNSLLQQTLQNAASKLSNQKMQAEQPYWGDDARAKLIAAQMANQINAPYATNADQVFRQDLASKLAAQQLNNAQTAQAIFYNKNPLMKMGGPAGQIGAAEYLRNLQAQGEPNVQGPLTLDPNNPQQMAQAAAASNAVQPGSAVLGNPNEPGKAASNLPPLPVSNNKRSNLADVIMSGVNAEQDKNRAYAALSTQKLTSGNWDSVPSPIKQDLLARARGAGYSEDDAAKQFREGKSLNDLYKAKGVDPAHPPEPQYAITGATKTQFQRSMMSNAELAYLNPLVSKWMGPYVQKFNGYSPKQIADAIRGINDEQQAQYIAGHMLAPELSSLRIKTQGGTVGVTFNEEMQDKALTNGKVFSGLVTPKVYGRANELVENALTEGGNYGRQIAAKGGITLSDEDLARIPGGNTGNTSTNTQKNFGSGVKVVDMVDKNGVLYKVHPEDVQTAITKFKWTKK